MNHQELLVRFWNEFSTKGPESATKFCNLYSNGLSVPTFIKFRSSSNKSSYACINIQEYLRSKHIEGLLLGYDKGLSDIRTSNIWYRLMRDVNLAINDEQFPKFNTKNLQITFHPVKCFRRGDNGPEEVMSGYIIFDYTS